MADPQRLVDDPDASPLARSLLAAADSDAPSSRDRAAVGKRLGIAAGLLAASGEVGAGSLAGAIGWKIGLLAVAVAGAITGGVALTREPAPEPPAAVAPAPSRAAAAVIAAPAASSEPAPSPAPALAAAPPLAAEPPPEPALAAPPPPAEPPPEPTVEPAVKPAARSAASLAPLPPTPPAPPAPPPTLAAAPVAPEPAPPPADLSAPADPPPAATPAAAAPAPAPTVDARRLAAEVAILDRARVALRGGDPTAATAALDEHARDFADGALLAEAELVRIETLIRAGDAGAARRRARDFLVRFPQSPLAKRLRSLVDRIPAPAPASAPASASAKESP